METGTAARWREKQKIAGEFDPQLVNVLDDELRGHSVSTSAPRVVAAHAGFALVESAAVTPDDGVQAITVAIETLRTGMVLVEELQTTSGTVLLRAGERLTAERLHRIQEFLREGILLTTTVSVVAGTLVTGSAPPIVHANQVGLLADT